MDDLSTIPEALLYQAIAQCVVDGIDGAWSSASVAVVIESAITGLIEGRYASSSNADEGQSFRLDSDCYTLFEELASRSQHDGQPAWNKARFLLRNDGSFDLKVSYPEA